MDRKILKRFFAGECSQEEHDRVISWYLSGQADRYLSERIEAYWKKPENQETEEWGKDALFQDIIQKIPGSSLGDKVNKPQEKKIQRYKSSFLPYAAVLALFLIVSSVWYASRTAPAAATDSSQNQSYIIKETENGEKVSLSLPDGTQILVNSGTSIRYSHNFENNAERVVYIEGEAFFSVTKNTRRPFKIISGEIITTVLGTSFNVEAYPNEDITISLVSGSVKIEGEPSLNEQRTVLKPGEQAVYGAEEKKLRSRKYDAQQVLAWKDGTLYFKNARFSDVVTKLERWYGIELEVGNNNIEDGFSGSYTQKSLNSVMEGMAFVLEFDYEIKGKHVIIK